MFLLLINRVNSKVSLYFTRIRRELFLLLISLLFDPLFTESSRKTPNADDVIAFFSSNKSPLQCKSNVSNCVIALEVCQEGQVCMFCGLRSLAG